MINLAADPLTGDWVSLADARQERPLTAPGQSTCPFCPGPSSEVGSPPFHVAVFPNRYPVFDGPGAAEVVVYSPRHHDDLGYLTPAHARLVWEVWRDRSQALAARPDVETVFVFENRGRRIGATIDHPHGQIYGYPYVPPRLAQEHRALHRACLLCELKPWALIIAESPHWQLAVPQAMRMPYQSVLVPRRHLDGLGALSREELANGAAMLQQAYRGYDHLMGFRASLAMGVHQAARGHLRLECLPIERGQMRQKYLAASELVMGAFVTDIPATVAANRLAAALRAASRPPACSRDLADLTDLTDLKEPES